MEERELPVGWGEARLEQITDILDSRRIPLNGDERKARIDGKKEQELFPYYGATGQVGLIDAFLFDEELILLGEDGVPFFDPLRHKAYLVSGRFWVNNHAHVLRGVAEVVDQIYLTAYLNQLDYTGYVTGSTRLKLTQAAMRGIPVPLAPLNEQRRIASKLDTTLAAVESCRQRLEGVAALIKRFRQAVLEAATTGELTREWREDQDAAFKEVAFRDLVRDARTGLVRSSQEQHEPAPGLTPYLKMDAIGEAWGCFYQGYKSVQCTDTELATYELQLGDWLFNTRNSLELVGKSCVWEGPAGVVYNNNILRVQFMPGVFPHWMEIFFRSPMGRDLLAGVKSATTSVAAIYQRSLMALPVLVPSSEEQAVIIDRVEALFSLADQLEAKLNAARQVVERLTPALLAKAFRGELVPQDPGDEPASELIARIRAARQVESGAGKPSRRGRRKVAGTPVPGVADAAPAPPDLLATLLRECGALSHKALLAASELEPDRFEAQREREVQAGRIRQIHDNGQDAWEAVG